MKPNHMPDVADIVLLHGQLELLNQVERGEADYTTSLSDRFKDIYHRRQGSIPSECKSFLSNDRDLREQMIETKIGRNMKRMKRKGGW